MSFHSVRTARVKSLVFSIYDGFFYSLMVGFSETYFSAYALYLGANNFQMGILTCLPPFLAGLCQFFTVGLLKLYPSRKRLVLTGVAMQAVSLVPIIYSQRLEFLRLEIYIFLVTFYFASNNTIGPIWNSWMGDLVNVAKRGVYFGRRNKMVTVGTFLSMTTAGFLLKYFKVQSWEAWGFYLIFFLAFLSRVISFNFLKKMYDAPLHSAGHVKFNFIGLCRDLPKKNYGNLILSMVLVNFGVYLAAAYYTPHLIRNLKVDYLTYTVLISSTLLFKYFSSGFWGEVVDTMGAKKTMVLTSLLICFTVIPWIFSDSIVLIFIAQCYTGIVWAGYELSTFTLLLDSTQSEERTQVTSLLNILNATSGFAGGIISAVLVAKTTDSAFAFKCLFASTCCIRLISYFLFRNKLKETRVFASIRTKDVLLKASGFKSTMGLTSRLVVFNKKK